MAVSTVQCEEMSVTFDLQPWHNAAERKVKIAWTDIDAFAAIVFPVAIPRGSGQTNGFGAIFPGKPWLRANMLHIEPFIPNKITGPDETLDFNTLATWDHAVATVQYATPTFNATEPGQNQPFNPDPEGAILDHKWSIGAEYITINPAGLVWLSSTDPVPDTVQIGKLIPTIEHQITWPAVVNPPFAAMRSCLGQINSATMNFQTGSIWPETLMFIGAELSRQVMSDGSGAWNVGYRFSERPIVSTGLGGDGLKGWNIFWNPISQVFDKIKTSSGASIFTSTDLTVLFRGG